mgnify:CR=1 FL=1
MEPMLKFRVYLESIEIGVVEVEAESKEAAISYVKDNLDILEVEWKENYDTDIVEAEEVE